MLEKLRGFIAHLRRDRAGAVGVFAAVTLPVMIGMSSLVGEYGYVLVVKTENQRVADAAAYAGAIAYSSASSQTAMTNAANAVAALNGVPASSVKATLLANSPTGDGSQAVQVQVTTSVPVYLAQIVGANTTVPVGATATAELSAQATPCVLALSNSGNGISGSGGTSVTTNQCSVASNASITLKGSATITTTSAAYGGSVNLSGSAAINTPSGTPAPLVKKTSADPLAGTSQVKAAYAGLANASTVTAPAGPPAGVGPLDFTYGDSAAVHTALAAAHCAAPAPSGGVWTVTCTAGSINNFGKLTVEGGVTLNFDVNATGTTTYTFSGGIVTGGGTHTSFGAGLYQIGGAVSCNGSTYSVCNMGTQLTFSGPSQFVITSGVYNGGGASLAMGAGTTNTFQVGPASDGNAFYTGGGAQTILADATGSAFKVDGNIISSGGTCMALSAAMEHDINGSIDTKGAVVLGSGPYYVTGFVAFGSGGGGNSTCNGSSIGVSATNVTLVIGGSSTPTTTSCKGEAFCVGAGYDTVTITGPSSGSLAGLAIVGPQSGSAGASFNAGAKNTSVSGAIYFPSAPITMSGAAGLGGGAGNCLEVIGSEISLSGGSAAASNCPAFGNNSTPSIQLVQ